MIGLSELIAAGVCYCGLIDKLLLQIDLFTKAKDERP